MSTAKKKAILLSRVSTNAQDVEQQTVVVRQQMLRDGYKENNIIVIENKESAVKNDEEHRLGLNLLKQAIEKDKDIVCVYVYELSRLGRRPDVNYSIRTFLQEHKVQLIIINPFMKCFNDDFSINASANLMFSLFNALAENEGYIRKERVARGKAKAVSEGRYTGGFILYGYKVDSKTKKFIVNEDEAVIVRKMFEMYNQGISTTTIYNEMYELGKFPSVMNYYKATKVLKLISNRDYTGCGMYPAIIDEATYEKACSRRRKFKTNPRATKLSENYLCKGIFRTYKEGYSYVANAYRGMYLINQYSATIMVHIADKLALDATYWYMREHYGTAQNGKKKAERAIATLQKKCDHIDEEIVTIKEKINKIWLRNIDGKISDEQATIREKDCNTEIALLEQKKDKFKDEIQDQYKIIEKYLHNKEVSVYDMSIEEQKIAIRECIEKILIEKISCFERNFHIIYKDGSKHIIYQNTHDNIQKVVY